MMHTESYRFTFVLKKLESDICQLVKQKKQLKRTLDECERVIKTHKEEADNLKKKKIFEIHDKTEFTTEDMIKQLNLITGIRVKTRQILNSVSKVELKRANLIRNQSILDGKIIMLEKDLNRIKAHKESAEDSVKRWIKKTTEIKEQDITSLYHKEIC